MRRRAFNTTVGAGPLSVAGCVALPDSDGSGDLPEDCPVSQDVGVEWPRDLNESVAATYVERYEEAYYRQQLIDTIFEPESRLFGFSGWIGRIETITAVEGGKWQVHFSGVVNIQRGDLVFEAIATDSTGDARVIPVGHLEDEQLVDVLEAAAEGEEASVRIEPSRSDEYLERFEQYSSEFEIAEVGDGDTLYFDVYGTTVEFDVWASPPNRNHFWDAWYYVDEHEVWRSNESDIDPRDGSLLECRDLD